MADLNTIRNRIEQQMISKGMTFREVSLKIGRKDSYIQQYIKYGFPKRLNEVDRKRVCLILDMEEQDLIDDELLQTSIKQEFIEDLPKVREKQDNYIIINIYAQTPNPELSSAIIGRLALNSKEFPNISGSSPYNLKIIRIDSDYMKPTYPSGSLILYDSGITTFSGDGVYIVESANITEVKRVQRLNANEYMVLNDNPMYASTKVAIPELNIVGKALFCLTTQAI